MLNKNIILITIDALRADHLSCMGYNRDTTPNLDRLANEGILYTQAISHAPYTTASITSFLTSTLPIMKNFKIPYPINSLCISPLLENYGYTTCGIHSNPWFTKYNYGMKFQYFIDPFEIKKTPFSHLARKSPRINKIYNMFKKRDINFSIPYARADLINQAAVSWYQKHQPKKFFLWMHYMDVHEPYNTFNGYINKKYEYAELKKIFIGWNTNDSDISSKEKKIICDLYDNEIKYVDNKIGELVEKFSELCNLKDTIIIITSDHGQELGDHGHYGHGGENKHRTTLYDEVLHVPLIIWCENNLMQNEIINRQIGLIDIFPTILDIIQLKKPMEYMGNSVINSDHKNNVENFVISQGIQCKDPNMLDYIKKGKKILSIRTNEYKYIHNGNKNTDELYDIKKDPKETKNIIDLKPDIAKKLEYILLSKILLVSDTKQSKEMK